MTARISVIVAVYNGERFLRDALESAFAQTLLPDEVILVDDGSTDATPEIARSFPVDYVRQDNAGVSAARNVAIARAQGDYLAMLDSDDIWLPEKLAVQRAALEGKENAYTICHHTHFTENGAPPPSWFTGLLTDPPVPGWMVPSSWMIPRAVWDRVGHFREELRVAEDLDWLTRARDMGIETIVTPETLVHKRLHDNNLTAQVESHSRVWLDTLRQSLDRRGIWQRGNP